MITYKRLFDLITMLLLFIAMSEPEQKRMIWDVIALLQNFNSINIYSMW